MSSSDFTFTINDIQDRYHLDFMIKEEAFRIYNSPKARLERSLEEITEKVKIGKIAEVYLIEQGMYKPAKDIYHDLVDDMGNYIEVKAYTVYDSNAPYVIRDLKRIRESTWNKSKWLILFRHYEGTYTFLEKILIRE
jgi:hypothetical protein